MTAGISSQSFTPTLVRSSDLASVKSSVEGGSDRDHVGGLINRIIQRLVDMCGGTNYTEVKKCAFDLYSSQTSDRQKFESFEKIKSLAGEGFKNRFNIEELSGQPGRVALAIELDDGEIHRFEVSKRELFFDKWDVEFNQDAINDDLIELGGKSLDEKQWLKDVERSGVKIGSRVVRSEGEFNAEAEKHGYSKDEILLAKKFCVQTINAIIWNRAIDGVQINSAVGENDLRLSYEMSRNEKGELNIDAVVEFDKSEKYSVEGMIEYMELAVESERGQISERGTPITHVREAALNLNIRFPVGQPPETHLSGHLGQYAGPVGPDPTPVWQMNSGLMPGAKA